MFTLKWSSIVLLFVAYKLGCALEFIGCYNDGFPADKWGMGPFTRTMTGWLGDLVTPEACFKLGKNNNYKFVGLQNYNQAPSQFSTGTLPWAGQCFGSNNLTMTMMFGRITPDDYFKVQSRACWHVANATTTSNYVVGGNGENAVYNIFAAATTTPTVPPTASPTLAPATTGIDSNVPVSPKNTGGRPHGHRGLKHPQHRNVEVNIDVNVKK
jgi:hypothetical protein